MFKLFVFEMKRLFSDIKLLIITCLLPILLLFVLGFSALPSLFTGTDIGEIEVILCNQDESPIMKMIADSMIGSDAIKERVIVNEVDDLETGKKMLQSGQSVCLVYIPEGFNQVLYEGGNSTISFYYSQQNQQLAYLIGGLIEDGIDSVNRAQCAVETIYYGMRTAGYTQSDAATVYNDLSDTLFIKILARGNLYEDSDRIGPFGNMLGFEFYSVALVLLLTLISSSMLAVKVNKDIASGVFVRGHWANQSGITALSKWMASTLFVAFQLFVLMIFVYQVNQSFWPSSNSIALIAAVALLTGAITAAMALFWGVLIRKTTGALWASFSFSLLICLASGLVLPSAMLPSIVTKLAQLTAVPQMTQLFSRALFGIFYDTLRIAVSGMLGLTVVWLAGFLGLFKARLRGY